MRKRFLHVGCGLAGQERTPFFNGDEWQEIRFDIDPGVNPDILGTLTDLGAVESDSVDAIFSSHNLEHVFPWEVPLALQEFVRVLTPDGFAVMTCPDLQEVCAHIAQGRLLETLYVSPIGPIRPIDIVYGHQASIEAGNVFMAHKGGFTQQTLGAAITKAGFRAASILRRPKQFDIWALGSKSKRTREECELLIGSYFPS
jgi:SAM-dependent methyltransferase